MPTLVFCRSSLLIGMVLAWQCTKASGEQPISFRTEIAPILQEHCVACHGPKRAEGGYRLDSYESLIRPGESQWLPTGQSQVEDNELLRRLVTDTLEERMPAEGDRLADSAIALVRRWLVEGAAFDGENRSDPLWKAIPPKTYPQTMEHYPVAIPVTSLVFSPDGTELISSGHHELLCWSTSNGSLVRRIENACERTYAMAWNRNRTFLAAGGGSPGSIGEVRLFDMASGQIRSIFSRAPDVVLDLAFRPGTDELAIAMSDGSIQIYDVEAQIERKVLNGHADWVTSIAWSDDGTKLISGSRDKSAKVYQGDSYELLASYPGHGAAVRGVSISTDSKQALTVGADQKLHRWEIEGTKKIAEVVLGSDGFRLLRQDSITWVPAADRKIHRIDLTSNTQTNTLEGHGDWVNATAAHKESQTIASGSMDGEIRLWNSVDGTSLRKWIAKP